MTYIEVTYRIDMGISIRIQPIFAKKIYDICKFQLFKKITVSRKILNTRRLYLDCICNFQAQLHKAKFFEEN